MLYIRYKDFWQDCFWELTKSVDTLYLGSQFYVNNIIVSISFITPPSGRGLVIPIFFPFFFFGGHLPQTSGFCSAKQILVVSFATQARAFILSDCNIFYTPGGGGPTAGSNAPGAFLVYKFKKERYKLFKA